MGLFILQQESATTTGTARGARQRDQADEFNQFRGLGCANKHRRSGWQAEATANTPTNAILGVVRRTAKQQPMMPLGWPSAGRRRGGRGNQQTQASRTSQAMSCGVMGIHPLACMLHCLFLAIGRDPKGPMGDRVFLGLQPFGLMPCCCWRR